MPTAARSIPRDKLLILVKDLLEAAGTDGRSKAELLTAIGPKRTSAASIQRVLYELRDEHDAPLRYDGRTRRWYLDAPLHLPLDAPDREDVVAVLIALAILEPIVDAELLERITKIVEDLDTRVRARAPDLELPSRKAFTSTFTLGTRVDPKILRALLVACRRKALRIRYASPWRSKTERKKWRTIEPWALCVHAGAVYLRAWDASQKEPRTFRLAHIDGLEDLAEQPASRHTPPSNLWGNQNPAFGIDNDRPGKAVIRMRGGIARWHATTIWHPSQSDVEIEPDEVLERTVEFRSCREFARYLMSMLDGIESIEPRYLCDEVKALAAHAAAL